MKKNYSKQEIEELILELSSENRDESDFAMQALMYANPRRHLADLIEALEYGDDITKQKICYIFGGTLDERYVDPLLSMLKDENINTRIAAIESLQFYPEERVIPHLKNQLQIHDEVVHQAVISTLGVYLKHGVQDAHLLLVEIVQDENKQNELRHLALKNLQYLEDDELKKLLCKLKNISDASIYSQILMLSEELVENKEHKLAQVDKLINEVLSEADVLKQMKLEDQLVEFGGIAVKALVKKLFDDPINVSLRIYSRMIFEKLVNKSKPTFKTLFETFDEFDDIYRLVIIQDLINMVARRKYISLAPSLLKLLNNLNSFIKANDAENTLKKYILIKSDIHLALAKYGSYEAIDDVKEMMQNGTERKYISLIQALQFVGDKSLLIPLINQYDAYRDSKRMKSIIKKVFWAIVKREKIKKNDPVFKNLSETQKQNLKLIVKR